MLETNICNKLENLQQPQHKTREDTELPWHFAIDGAINKYPAVCMLHCFYTASSCGMTFQQ